ncbi:MAG: DUF2812 domain-containing protein [Lysinibacillus sp.]
MVKTKTIASEGIAFSEKKDLKALQKWANKGWHVTRFKGMGYELVEGEPTDYIFSIDIRNLKEDEKDEYYEMFQMAGWEHISSDATRHLFRAAPGTPQIYTDLESERGKLKRLLQSITPVSLFAFIMLFFSLLLTQFTSGTLLKISGVFLGISIACATPCAMMLITLYVRMKRLA